MVHHDSHAERASRGHPAKLILRLTISQNDFALGDVLKTTDKGSLGKVGEKSWFGSDTRSNR
jgi:hypothetical protein